MTHRDGGVWVALPTYNERLNLEPLVTKLLTVVPEAHVLVVDDNSPDGTGRLADALAARDSRVEVLHRAGKEGLGVAYRAAFEHLLARTDCRVVVQMDCDFSHDPADVPRLLAALAEGADVAIGSRYVTGGDTPGWSLARRLISRGGSLFARTVLGLPLHDLTGGFKAWRADVLRRLEVSSVETQGYGFQIATTWRAHRVGASIREIPIVFRERRAGTSKMNRRILVEALLMVVGLRLGTSGTQPRAEDRSTHLGAREIDRLALVPEAGRVALDDLDAVPVPTAVGPSGGGLPTDGARHGKVRY